MKPKRKLWVVECVASASKEDQERLMELAIGRVFRLMSRPYQEGDIEDFERCYDVVMAVAEAREADMEDRTPNYARDRMKGAAGD